MADVGCSNSTIASIVMSGQVVTTNDVSTEETEAILTESPIEMIFTLNVSIFLLYSQTC